jgi:hypothetical protein
LSFDEKGGFAQRFLGNFGNLSIFRRKSDGKKKGGFPFNEYLAAENQILRGQIKGRLLLLEGQGFCFQGERLLYRRGPKWL